MDIKLFAYMVVREDQLAGKEDIIAGKGTAKPVLGMMAKSQMITLAPADCTAEAAHAQMQTFQQIAKALLPEMNHTMPGTPAGADGKHRFYDCCSYSFATPMAEITDEDFQLLTLKENPRGYGYYLDDWLIGEKLVNGGIFLTPATASAPVMLHQSCTYDLASAPESFVTFSAPRLQSLRQAQSQIRKVLGRDGAVLDNTRER